jgi:hypothetical protein
VLEMINYISILAYAVLKGRRWFLWEKLLHWWFL